MIIRFSARNLGSVASERRSSSSSSGVAPRGVVPLIGLVSIVRSPSSSLVMSAYRSGDELSSHPRAPRADVVLQEPGVRRGVELAQPQVRRDRVEVALRVEPVGEVHLVAVAGVQRLLDLGEGCGVGGWRGCGFPGHPGIPDDLGAEISAEIVRFPRVPGESSHGAWSNSRTWLGRIHTASGTPSVATSAGRSGRQA